MAQVILIISVVLQLLATWMAFRMASERCRRTWMALAGAIFLMTIRRIYSLMEFLFGLRLIDAGAESIALVISAMMVVGIWGLKRVKETEWETRHDSSEELELEEGASQLSRTALFLGIIGILGGCLVGIHSYKASREAIVKAIYEGNLNLSRTLMAQAELHQEDLDEGEILREIQILWKKTKKKYPNRFLCVVGPDGRLLLHTKRPHKVGVYVGDVPIPKRPVSSIAGLLASQSDWVGENVGQAGHPQVAAYAFSPRLRWILAIHITKDEIDEEIHKAALPWAIGFTLITVVLLPLSLFLMRRAYFAAARAAAHSKQNLRKQHNLLHSVIEGTSDAVFVKDRDGRFLLMNTTAATMLGVTPEEVVGKDDHAFFPESEVLEILEVDHKVMESGKAITIEENLTMPLAASSLEKSDSHEKVICFLTAKAPYRDAEGNVIGTIGIARDITARKQAERELRESEEAIRHYSERLKMLHETDLAILEARSPAEIARESLKQIRRVIPCVLASVGVFDFEKGLFVLLHVDSEKQTDSSLPRLFLIKEIGLSQAFWDGQVEQVEDLETFPSISTIQQWLLDDNIRSYISIPLITRGKIIGALNFGSNQVRAFDPEHLEIGSEVANQMAIAIQQASLHEQVKQSAEKLEQRVADRTEELKERIDEVEELNQSMANLLEDLRASNVKLEIMTHQLEEANEGLEAFNSSVSHDLRAPLRSMQGFSVALKEDYGDQLDEEGNEYLDCILQSAKRMDALIQDLLAYSRLNQAELKLTAISLDSVVREVVAHTLKMSPIDADLEFEIPFSMVIGHKAILHQVLTNLIGNAMKFVVPENRPKVIIRVESQEQFVRLWVEDNGIGIDSKYLERIFGIFERLHGIEEYPGTGIGLAIVKKGVERLGGRVGVESELGKGSKFWIELKRSDMLESEQVEFSDSS